MATGHVTPCEAWTSRDEIDRCCGNLCSSGERPSVNEDLIVDAIWWASAVLYRLDKRRLRGACTVTVSACFDQFTCGDCGQQRTGWEVTGPIGPVSWSTWYTVWRNLAPSTLSSPGWSQGVCGCATRCDAGLLLLPVGPILSVDRVWVDDVEVTGPFVVVDRVYAQRADGAAWPTGSVIKAQVQHGRPIPRDARAAASELACHWLRGHCGADGCALPETVTSITREELSLEVVPEGNLDRLKDGLLGMRWVDSWLASRNVRGTQRVLTTAAPPVWRDRRG